MNQADANPPDLSVYGSSYFAATMVPADIRPSLALDLDADVCVIGGGLAGLTAAREIALRGWSVILLEARRLAWNASGRNTGFVLPGFGQSPEAIVARVGLERAKALWALSEAGVDYVRSAIAERGLPRVDPQPGWLQVSKAERRRETADSVALLRRAFGANVEFWSTGRVRAHLKSTHYFQGIYFPDAFHIHPLNYALGLARAAEEAGVRIFENAPAVAIDLAGIRKRIDTPQGRVRTAHVVLAGNVHIRSLMPDIARTLVPVTTYVGVTAPLGERLFEAMDYSGAVSDTELADNHYRIVGGDRLLWSGRVTTHEVNPKRYAGALIRDLRRTFPQLGHAKLDHIWCGTLGNTVHRMPQIGEISPGVWIASGFGGHGLNTTAMAGNLVARGIVDGNRSWQQFAPFEMVWAGGAFGRAAAKLKYWSSRTRERLEGHVSRRRETQRHRHALADTWRAEKIWRGLLNADEPYAAPPPQVPANQVEEAQPIPPDVIGTAPADNPPAAAPAKRPRRKPAKRSSKTPG